MIEEIIAESDELNNSIKPTDSGYGINKDYESKKDIPLHFTDIAYGLKFSIYTPLFAMDSALGYTWVNQGMAYLNTNLSESLRTEVGIHEYLHNKNPDHDEMQNRVNTARQMHNLIGDMEFHRPYLG